MSLLFSLYSNDSTFWMTTGLYPQEIVISVQNKQPISRINVEANGASTIEVMSSDKSLPTNFVALTQLSFGADGWQSSNQSFPAVGARYIKLVVTHGFKSFAAIKHVSIH
jgi:heat shock protein beta-11